MTAQVLRGLEAGDLPERLQPMGARLRAAAHTEAAVQAHDVGRIADAAAHLEAAEQLLGIHPEVTGACARPGLHLEPPAPLTAAGSTAALCPVLSAYYALLLY